GPREKKSVEAANNGTPSASSSTFSYFSTSGGRITSEAAWGRDTLMRISEGPRPAGADHSVVPASSQPSWSPAGSRRQSTSAVSPSRRSNRTSTPRSNSSGSGD